ncbi:MAG: beta-galactosidase [Anaerolineales bacterium]|jgi:hypothetical protein
MDNIRLAFYLILFLGVLLAACQATDSASPEIPTPLTTAASIERSTPADMLQFRDGFFFVDYPDWPVDTNSAQENEIAVAQGGFGVWVKRHATSPRIVALAVLERLEGQPKATLLSDGEHGGYRELDYLFPFEDLTLRSQTRLVYCDGGTYSVTVAGIHGLFDIHREIFSHVLNSTRCNDPNQVPELASGKLGMVVNPASDGPLEGTYPALRLAKESGVQVIHTYQNWAAIEDQPGLYSWEWQDYLMDLYHYEGFEVSLVFDIIHTTVRGETPPDLDGLPFDDPRLIQRFTECILAFLDRYPGQVHYLSIGNEVNDYFVNHRDEVDAYRTFFLAVKDAIAARHPDVMVSMTYAYHDAESQDSLDVIEQLNVGDFIPFTLYIYSDGFRFDQGVHELGGYIDRMLAFAEEKSIAIVELGWSTSPSLGASQSDQAAFIQEVFGLLPQYRSQIIYLTWFSLHDGVPENCHQAALGFIPHLPELAQDEAFMSVFVDFLCYLGLRESDGTPKLGWDAWQGGAARYLEGINE